MTDMLSLTDITLEGPDLSGKTRLYYSLHKMTNFKWNIQDRAEISMAVYSEMYGRPDSQEWWEKVYVKLSNLSHRYVILLPSFDLLIERYHHRGDDVQNEQSLSELHKRFTEAVSKLSKYPTCIVVNVTRENQSDVKNLVLSRLERIQSSTTKDTADEIFKVAKASSGKEANGLHFVMSLTNFSSHDYSVLEYEKEKAYYKRISDTYIKTIYDELAGDNEYGIPQDPVRSRRFVYCDMSCISYINTHIRNKTMTMSVVCRSSDTENTIYYDICFLQILAKKIENIFRKTCDINRVIMKVRLDSAHVIEENK